MFDFCWTVLVNLRSDSLKFDFVILLSQLNRGNIKLWESNNVNSRHRNAVVKKPKLLSSFRRKFERRITKNFLSFSRKQQSISTYATAEFQPLTWGKKTILISTQSLSQSISMDWTTLRLMICLFIRNCVRCIKLYFLSSIPHTKENHFIQCLVLCWQTPYEENRFLLLKIAPEWQSELSQ